MHDIGLKVIILEKFYTQEEKADFVRQTLETSQPSENQDFDQLDAINKFFKELEIELREEIEEKVG